jgi:hypothetical protein
LPNKEAKGPFGAFNEKPGIDTPAIEVGIEIIAINFFIKILDTYIYGIFRTIYTQKPREICG